MAPNLCFEDILRIKQEDLTFLGVRSDCNEYLSLLPDASKFNKRAQTREMWRGRQSSKELPVASAGDSVSRALRSIQILDSSIDSENHAWLKCFRGELYNLDDVVLEKLVSQAPQQLAARVADSNGNLLYEMQNQTGQMNALLDKLGISGKILAEDYLGSYLTTERTIPQPAHVDYTWEVLEGSSKLYLAFFPLSKEGMFLQVWPRNDDADRVMGELVFIPYGRLLVLPASTIHGGGFRTTPSGDQGNLRFHLYFVRGRGGKLPTHQTNKYTEPHDKRRELCERYIDNHHVVLLQECLFV
jgi:hypothetical protein